MERITCPVCCGDGQLEYEINRPQSFTRDVGYIDTVWDECLECHGEGEVEAETRSCQTNSFTEVK